MCAGSLHALHEAAGKEAIVMIEAKIDLDAETLDPTKVGGSCRVRVTEEQEGRTVAITEKEIPLKDFLSALEKAYSVNARNVYQKPVGPFPEHTFMYCQGSHRDKILFYEPGKKRLFIQGEKAYMIYMPNVLFGLTFGEFQKQYKAFDLYAWIYEGDLTPQTRLYEYPFGHVYSGGSVCTGNSIVGKDLREIVDAAKDVFFNAPNRGHAYRPESLFATDEFRSMALTQVLRRAGKAPIPFSNFVPTKYRAGDVFDRI